MAGRIQNYLKILDRKEAIEKAREAIELYIESLKAHEEEIPIEEIALEYTVKVKVHA